MKARPYPKWITRLFIFTVGMLGFTGMMQMPLAKRYFLTDIPGMAWSGDFFLVHKLHYALSALLLFMTAMIVVHWFREWTYRLTLTPLGVTRVVILGGLIISGGFRVYRNMPDVNLHPALILTIEWVHLSLAMFMGAVALIALIRGRSSYARLN